METRRRMHEFSIATQLLDKVLEAARLHGAARGHWETVSLLLPRSARGAPRQLRSHNG